MKTKLQPQTCLVFLFFQIFLHSGLNAQQISSCAPPGVFVPGTLTCEGSCIYCDLNGINDRNFVALPSPQSTFCLLLENPRWYGFIAGTTDITIQATPTFTTTGDGLQAMVTDGCGDILYCTNGHAGGAILPATVFLNNLIVGHPYQLCVDGYLGDKCIYTISVVTGSTMPPPLGPIGTLQGLTQVCPNATVTYTVPPVTNAVGYHWTAPAGASINGGSNNALVAAPGGNTVQITFGAQGGTVCVNGSNDCSTPVTSCLTVTNIPLPVVDLGTEVVCYQSLPYVWPHPPNNFIVSPGTYNLTSAPVPSFLGCDSIVKQKVIVYPPKIVNLPPIYLCQGTCYHINGNEYCQSGSYAETIQTINGCDSLVNFNLHIVPAHALIQHPDTITCNVPSVTLNSTGSTTGNTVNYNWTTSSWQSISTGPTATATPPDSIYHLIVNNFGGGMGCHDTATVVVQIRTAAPAVNAGPPKVIGCSLSQVNLQGTASTGPQFSYLWTASNGGNIVSGAATLTPAVNAAGTYTLHVTNTQTGCTSLASTVVTATSVPPVASATGGTLTCTNPAITLQSTTNAGQPLYSWTGPNGFTSTAPAPVVNAVGVYLLTVTNPSNSCTATASATVNADNTPPGAIANGGMLTCTVDSIALSGHTTAMNAAYSWTGPNGFISNLANPTVHAPGDYILQVTGANGCTSTSVATIVLNNTPPGASIDVSGSLNCSHSTVNLVGTSTANPSGLEHVWTLPDNTQVNTGTGTLLAANAPGVYKLLITNTVNGCTSSSSATVIQHAPVTAGIAGQSNANCFGAANGQLSASAAGGDSNYSFLWNNGTGAASNLNLSPGNYTVTITDGEGCTATATGVVTQPGQLLANAGATPQSAAGASDGTASASPAGGTPGYSYLWSNGGTTSSITGLNPGLYTVTVTDSHGCTAIQTTSVNAYNCTIEASASTQNVGCFGETNGSASINISGGTAPFVYNWSNGTQTSSSGNLGPGFYSVSVTDAANCLVAVSFTILQSDTLLANVSAIPSSGPTTNNGIATASPTGGSGTYTYVWNTGATTALINNLPGGTYTVTVTDSNNCSVVQSTVVTVGHCGVVNGFLVTNPPCSGSAGGSATVVLTGGFPPFTYLWSSGGTGGVESGLGAGEYLVSITDVNGCRIVDSTHLTEPPLLTATLLSTTNTICKNDPSGAISLAASGGTGALTVLWTNGQTQFSISSLLSGTYTATVTDENGCTAVKSAIVLAIDLVPPTIQIAPFDTIPLGPSGAITLTAQNLSAVVADNCTVASVKITPDKFTCADIGTHVSTMTVTDDSGNSSSQTFTVTIVDNAPPTLTCPPSVVRCFGDNNVQYDAPTALDNCLALGGTFMQTSGLQSGSVFPQGTTTNTYTFSDNQGNTGSCSFEVTILSALTLKVDTVINDVNNQHIGSIHLTVNGSLPPYHFTWTENGNPLTDSTGVLSGIGQGDYHVVVTDANGCTVETTIIHVTTATKNPGWDAEIGIYPNPTTGNLTVVLPDGLIGKSVLLSAWDQTGRKVYEQTCGREKQIKLDFSKLAAGMYYLRVQLDENQVIRKIVINR
jgi:hypothetical protein